MKRRCKYQQELMHAWANKTPEGKQREKEYNSEYYKRFKEDWVRRKAARAARLQSGPSSKPSFLRREQIGPSPTPTRQPGYSENSLSKKNESVIPTVQDFREIFDLVGTVGNAVKKGASAVGRFAKTIFKTPVKAVTKKSNGILDDIKSVYKDAFGWFLGK